MALIIDDSHAFYKKANTVIGSINENNSFIHQKLEELKDATYINNPSTIYEKELPNEDINYNLEKFKVIGFSFERNNSIEVFCNPYNYNKIYVEIIDNNEESSLGNATYELIGRYFRGTEIKVNNRSNKSSFIIPEKNKSQIIAEKIIDGYRDIFFSSLSDRTIDNNLISINQAINVYLSIRETLRNDCSCLIIKSNKDALDEFEDIFIKVNKEFYSLRYLRPLFLNELETVLLSERNITTYTKIHHLDKKNETIIMNHLYEFIHCNEVVLDNSITINVISDHNLPIYLSEITLYDTNLNIIAKKNTTNNGVVIFNNLDIGSYIIKQTSVPSKYNLNKDEIQFQIESGDENLEFDIVNTDTSEVKENGNIKITIINSKDSSPIKDIDISIENSKISLKTNENGIANISNLEYGTYKLLISYSDTEKYSNLPIEETVNITSDDIIELNYSLDIKEIIKLKLMDSLFNDSLELDKELEKANIKTIDLTFDDKINTIEDNSINLITNDSNQILTDYTISNYKLSINIDNNILKDDTNYSLEIKANSIKSINNNLNDQITLTFKTAKKSSEWESYRFILSVMESSIILTDQKDWSPKTLTNEDIYGPNYDGENRKYELWFIGFYNYELTECVNPINKKVPLNNIDTFDAPNYAGAFNFDGDLMQITFTAGETAPTGYELRLVK